MESEGNRREYKSVLKIRNGLTGLKDLAATCVAFANTQGGDIFIGIENVSRVSPSGQIITKEEVNDAITRLRTLCSNVLITPSTILKDGDGGDYFIITISPSVKSIASTADGKFFVRVGDETQPVRSEDIMHLASEKQAFQWELVCTRKVSLTDVNKSSLKDFADKIRHSDRVSEHIVQMTDYEIAENYNLLEGEYLTNLGILWIGTPAQRSHDRYGLEADAVLHLDDGRYALVECKLGGGEIEDGAKHLIEIRELVRQNNEKANQTPIMLPDLLIVLTGGEMAYTRLDGVKVIPLGCLKD